MRQLQVHLGNCAGKIQGPLDRERSMQNDTAEYCLYEIFPRAGEPAFSAEHRGLKPHHYYHHFYIYIKLGRNVTN